MIFKHSVPILYSADVRRSINYYTGVLGFESKWEWDDPPTFGGVSKNGVEIFFCREAQGNPGTWIAVMVDKVDELYEAIKEKGGKVLSVPKNMEWGLREMLVEDPDGHVIRFGQNAPPPHREKSLEMPEDIRMLERVPSVKEYQQLTSAVGWHIKSDDLIKVVLDAAVFGGVAENKSGEVIGCVLLLGDNASFYYVKDMMVHPHWQSKHVGTALMHMVSEWLEKNAPDHALVGLYTGENLAPFYRQFGFREAFGMCRRISRSQ